MNVVGLMSGTSVDGVDAAFVEIEEKNGRPIINTVAWTSVPFDETIRSQILDACNPGTATVDGVSRLNVQLGELFAEAARAVVERSGRSLAEVDLIASHGQTIYHAVGPGELVKSTLQIGSPAVIAEKSGRTVVSDFRPRDIAAGGQGAPLASFVDYLLIADGQRSRALQNIGGIGNVTFIPVGATESEIIAFDTGPGNMVIDGLVQDQFGQPYDLDGRLAAAGRVDEPFLAQLLAHPYFDLSPPKTTGREQFGAEFVANLRREGESRGLAGLDLVATATALTARSIAGAYRRFLPSVDEIILSGGGASNATIVTWLSAALATGGHRVTVRRIDEFGISADAKEAIVFAVLGYLTLHGRTGTLPSCTGASHPVVLGSIVPGDNFLDLVRRISDTRPRP